MANITESKRQKIFSIVALIITVVAFVVISKQIPSLFNFFQNTEGNSVYSDFKKSDLREDLNKKAVIDLTNKARAQNGLPPLKENPLLDAIAQARARDMLEKQYFDHVSPTGQQASDIAQSIGYHYKVIAENIGSGDFYTNQKIVDGWMQSPSHRNNILSAEVQEIGVEVLKGRMKGAQTYVSVQIFGLQSLPVPPNVCAVPSENLLHDIEVKKAEIESLRGQQERMKNELDRESESIEADKRSADDDEKMRVLNERINVFNEKIIWYNKTVQEAKAKEAVAESMINEYNRALQAYKECRASEH